MFEVNMYQIAESKIKNGLSVIIAFNPSAENVFVSLWVKCGARDENVETSGYSHVLEHMLLKGTKTFPSQLLFDSELEQNGAFARGMTSPERTIFYIESPAAAVEKMTALLAQIIFEPVLDQTILETEKKVIIEEQNLEEHNIQSYFNRLSFLKFFEGHPLGQNVLGTKDTVHGATIESLKKHIAAFYGPTESALVFVGSVNHETAVALAEKYYSSWSNPVAKKETTPFILSHKHLFEKKDIKLHYLNLGFSITGEKFVSDEEAATLSILSSFLGFGKSSWHFNNLRKNGLVYAFNHFINIYSDAGRFVFSTSTTKPEETLKVFADSMHSLPTIFTKEACERAKIKFINNYTRIYANPLENLFFLGGQFVTESNMFIKDRLFDAVKQIDYKKVLDIGQKCLNFNNSKLTVLGPNDPHSIWEKLIGDM